MDNSVVNQNQKNITKEFSNEHLLSINEGPWFAYMANYKATKGVPKEYT